MYFAMYRLGHEFYSPPLDIDECDVDTDNCDMNAVCDNTIGSFGCTCNPGYSGDGTVCLSK